MHAAVQAELNLLNEGLQHRQQAAAAKALLELMQDTAHAMAKVRECCTTCEYRADELLQGGTVAVWPLGEPAALRARQTAEQSL